MRRCCARRPHLLPTAHRARDLASPLSRAGLARGRQVGALWPQPRPPRVYVMPGQSPPAHPVPLFLGTWRAKRAVGEGKAFQRLQRPQSVPRA